MDCRGSLVILLGLGGLAGMTGCKTTEPIIDGQPIPITQLPPDAKINKARDLPRRAPTAESCWRFGDFSLREATVATKTPAEQQQYRKQARMAYQQALQIDPKCAEAHRGMAQVALAENDDTRAFQAFQAGVKVQPKVPGLWYELGMLHARRKEWGPSLECLRKASSLDPDNRTYSNLVGFALARSGKIADSVAHFAKHVGQARAHYNVACMLNHMGHQEECRKHLQLAVREEPTFVQAHQMLAQMNNPAASGPIAPVNFEQEMP